MPASPEKMTCVCAHVRRAGRQLSQLYNQYLRPAGILSTQYGMLRCVAELPEPFISDIGRILGMDQTTVTRNIMKLEKMELVRTRMHPNDPRKKIVELSEAGHAKILEAQPLWHEAQKHVTTRMGEESINKLMHLLMQLTETAEKF